MQTNKLTLCLFAPCCFLSGMVTVLACSGPVDGPMIAPAMAQLGYCNNWRLRSYRVDETEAVSSAGASLPAGWTPLSNHTNYWHGAVLIKCDD